MEQEEQLVAPARNTAKGANQHPSSDWAHRMTGMMTNYAYKVKIDKWTKCKDCKPTDVWVPAINSWKHV